MRGSPVLRGLAVVAALLVLLVPLIRMTSSRTPATALPRSEEPHTNSAVVLRLTSSSAPFTFSVSHLGSVIWAGNSLEPRIEKELSIPFPAEGIDLLVSANWETTAPSALEVAIIRDGRQPSAQTLWGEGSVSDVLTFR